MLPQIGDRCRFSAGRQFFGALRLEIEIAVAVEVTNYG
jgi:hypothetical protein